MKWSSNISNTAEAEIEITFKCATDGDKTTELGYQNEGFTKIARSFLLEQMGIKELSRLELQMELKLNLLAKDIRASKVAFNLHLVASSPSNEPTCNLPSKLTEETSRLKDVQKADREAERKRRQALNPKGPGASPHRRRSDRQDRSGRGSHEFPRP